MQEAAPSVWFAGRGYDLNIKIQLIHIYETILQVKRKPIFPFIAGVSGLGLRWDNCVEPL